MPGDASSAASYATAADNLRTATRWLLTAAAAAAAVMVAGLQLTSIGSLGPSDWPRLIAAVVGLAAGLGAVGYMIFQASLLLTDEWITLAEMELESFKQQLRNSSANRDKRRLEEINRIHDKLQNYQDEFYGSVADSIQDLYQRLIEANRKARESPSAEHAQTAADLKRAVDALMQAANYSYTRSGFEVLRWRLAKAGAVFVTGIVVFAYAANPPKPASKTTATGHATTQVSPAPKSTIASRTPARSTPRPQLSPRRLRLDMPDEPRAARECRGGVQNIRHEEAKGGHPPALFPPQPLQLFLAHRPVERYIRVEGERSPRVDHVVGPGSLVTGPHVAVEPDRLIGIRPIEQLGPQRVGKLFTFQLRQAQNSPDCRWPQHYLVLGTHPAPPGADTAYGGRGYVLNPNDYNNS